MDDIHAIGDGMKVSRDGMHAIGGGVKVSRDGIQASGCDPGATANDETTASR